MPLRTGFVALAVLAAACAPAPSLDGLHDQAESDDVSPPTTAAPALDETDSEPADGREPVELEPVPGRIVTHNGTATIRTGDSTIDLETGDLPTQPTWARDGSRLVIVSLDGRIPVVDVFDGTNGEPIHQTFAERRYFFFSWSHDGTRIAALGPGTGGTTLDILDADGNLLYRDVARAGSLYLAWEPGSLRLIAHADESLLRIDADGTATDLGTVGVDFFAPKWIPGSSDVLIVVDIEGTSTLVRRGIEGGDSMTTLGAVESQTGISVDPDGHSAAISMTFEAANGGSQATSHASGDSRLVQAEPTLTGTVEIVDLLTGERQLILEGLTFWMEWSPDGSRLLLSTFEPSTTTTTWWIYEAAPFVEPVEAYPVTSFTPTPIFLASYMVFADQFIEQQRLWSPASDTFVFAEETPQGSLVRIAPAHEDADTSVIGPGEVGFWSPAS